MCGRFSLSTVDKQVLMDRFNVSEIDYALKPRYNIAPSQDIAVILNDSRDKIQTGKWGLVPQWAKNNSMQFKTINARSETVMDKPAYRNAYKKHRCLVIADSYYEWDKVSGTKNPYRIQLKNEGLFSFGGIFEMRENIATVSIITTKPNSMQEKIHVRMPLILPKDREEDWLTIEDPRNLMKPYQSNGMKMQQITRLVNDVHNDSIDVIKPESTTDGNLSKFF